MINPRISAIWSTNKQITSFCSTPRVQEVHSNLAEAPYPWPPRLRSIIQLLRKGNVLRNI